MLPDNQQNNALSNKALVLVKLSKEQIEKVKAINGSQKKTTHCLVCGGYGQLFGTGKHCRKYFTAWRDIFATLFDKTIETDSFEISNYHSTFNLVLKLIDLQDTQSKY